MCVCVCVFIVHLCSTIVSQLPGSVHCHCVLQGSQKIPFWSKAALGICSSTKYCIRSTRLHYVPPHLSNFRYSLMFIGISSFASEPEQASVSLRPLLEFASAHIPVSKHHETSLYILCTAGMRLLATEVQDRIVLHLEETVTREWPFRLPKDGIQVISGKLEGQHLSLCHA